MQHLPRPVATSECSRSALTSNLKAWYKDGHQVVYTSDKTKSTKDKWPATEIIRVVDNGDLVVLCSEKLSRRITVSKNDKQELPYRYSSSPMKEYRQGNPAGPGAYFY